MTEPSGPFQLLLSELRVKSFKEGKVAQRSEVGEFPRHAGRLCGAIRKWENHYGLHYFPPEFYAMWGATPPIPTSDQFRVWEQQILHALELMGDRVIVTANEAKPRFVVGFENFNITNDPDIPGSHHFEPTFEGRLINSIIVVGLAYTYLGNMYLNSEDVATAPLRDFIAYNGWAYGADEIGMYYAMDNITVYSARNWWSMVFAESHMRPMPSRNFHWYFLPDSTPTYLTSDPPVPRVKTILEQVHKSHPSFQMTSTAQLPLQ